MQYLNTTTEGLEDSHALSEVYDLSDSLFPDFKVGIAMPDKGLQQLVEIFFIKNRKMSIFLVFHNLSQDCVLWLHLNAPQEGA